VTSLLHHITRVRPPARNRPSWRVRVYRGSRGTGGTFLVDQAFYDADYGGARNALIAAKGCRDRTMASRRALLPKGYQKPPHRGAGVHYSQYWHRGRLRGYWAAVWQEDGRQRTRRFEITADRPFDKAQTLAKEWRERMVGQRP
jgi:hypothetical protein